MNTRRKKERTAMTETSRKILESFQIRKSNRQKAEFRGWLCEELRQAGYAPKEEPHGGLVSGCNLVVGDPERAELLCTAHYDTCAVMPVPNFITPRNMFWYLLYQFGLVAVIFLFAAAVEVAVIRLFDPPSAVAVLAMEAAMFFCLWWLMFGPANRRTANDNTSGVVTLVETALALPEELRNKVCFVFFDNEEKGLFGSAAFAKAHPAAKNGALVLNFDCVGEGDSLQFFPGKELKKDAAALERLENAFVCGGGKTAEAVRGFGFYPSDQKHFRRGMGVCALKKNRVFGYYMDKIHTKRDTVLDEENIRILRDGVLRLLGAEVR